MPAGAGRPNGNGRGPNGARRRSRNGRGGASSLYATHRRRDRNRRRRDRSTKKRLLVLLAAAAAVLALAMVAGAALTGASAFRSSCDLSSLRPVTIGQNSFVYAADGSLLGAIPAERNREPLRLEQMSPRVAQAAVAIEDKRFYEHGGLDFEGIGRAVVKNIEAHRIVEGGSTITQQLVRNLYIGNERTYERKLKEACLALKLDNAWSKRRILETYLNQVYFGNHAYGVEAASQTYFSRHAKDLTLPQAALLAGLPQAPSVYDPFTRPDEAVRRRNEVLLAMLNVRAIDAAEYQRATLAPLRLERGKIYTRIREPYFFSYVRDELIRKYGVSTVRSGGLRVYTTIKPRYQRAAVAAIKQTLPYSSDPASAIVSIDPKTGAIRAMAAVAPGKHRLVFNLAAQGRRQAGSAFKTFVLTEAVKEGINPDTTTYLSAPFHWQPVPGAEPWDVKTFDETYVGPTSITNATLRSDNTVYARLTLDVGPENVARTAREMGIKTRLEPVASIGLGSNSVSVLEMASAYATLAAGGVYSEPMAIRKVVLANGKVDDEAGWGKPKRRRVLQDGVAYEVTRVLEQNMLSGTAVAAYFGRPAAGKTGTTDNYADAWLCGYTPDLATAVWVGYPDAQIEMRNVHGISVQGGSFPAQIWHLYMSAALAGTPVSDFPPPLQPVVWQAFHGQYAFSGPVETSGGDSSADEGAATSAPATSEVETTAPPATTTAPPTTTAAPPPPPPAPPPPTPTQTSPRR